MKKLIICLLLFVVNSLFAQPDYVTTIYPFQAILTGIVGSRADVHAIIPPGASPHTYEIKPSDIQKIHNARALFYGSQNLDKWALTFQHSHKIQLLGFVPDSMLLKIKDYFQHVATDMGTDPHFWTDPLTVARLLPHLTDSLCALDPKGHETYRQNSRKFGQNLQHLTAKIDSAFNTINNRAVVLSHPFFQYYLNRFQFKLVGIIEAVPGKEPTPKKLKTIIETIQQKNVKVIITQAQLSGRAAKLVSESTGAKLVELDPLGGFEGRQTYEELIWYNTRKLLEAFE